ncbi:caspase family protein [Bradyrhizobium sp. AUGA SZCCT0042]|uniref:caspase family protein n=1 Tax=Bradyrhizobium sp. AUGA SZCCT0042 TaxID=2807651 RepID=UPI001BA44AEF|nr:caspase family protein [Bradyrhizobium sp. AUGA SZCCT0042]MBR1299260.1 caspase family protein [Bradyrhizobium sp. AUGA SZCCT0042]
MSRIAIVIGVNKPKAPAPLQGAVNDAKAFSDWIAKQGFEVRTFTDDKGPVAFACIFNEVDRVVDAATYSQVVFYFAGHGFQNGSSEIWLLSGAPNNASEAISVEASVMAARESGLKNVVFISDACRSIPSRMQDSRVDGGSIFPNVPLKRRTRPEIDRVFATLPSLVAVEAAKADDNARLGGIFTKVFMAGYLNPPPAFIDKVPENGGLIEVVTNRKLKELIYERVQDAASEEMPKAGQTPEFILESVQAYVGRVARVTSPLNETGSGLETLGPRRRPAMRKRLRREAPVPSVAALALQAIEAAAQGQGARDAAAAVRKIGHGASISDAIDRYLVDAPVDHFETQTGFAVTGAQVVGATSPQFPAEILGTQLVRLHPARIDVPSTSVLIEFDGGSGTVLPGLRGYIGHVFVDGGRVSNVNYVPSTNSKRWSEYQNVRRDIEALRAAVAAAASLGVFRIAPQEAQAFANNVRQLKVFDPALGLYAAYAFASAGIDDQVESVLEYMRRDLVAELFDVAMLARRGVRPREAGADAATDLPILPFCPMLRQGWSLLAVRDAQLPDAVRKARDWLLPALWTTFAPQGVELLREAIKRGDLQ